MIRRLNKELSSAPREGSIHFVKCDETNIAKQTWIVVPGAGSTVAFDNVPLTVHVTIPLEYPFKPPVAVLENDIFHPNVLNCKICLNITNMWQPQRKILEMLEELRTTIMHPNTDTALCPEAADSYINHRDKYIMDALQYKK